MSVNDEGNGDDGEAERWSMFDERRLRVGGKNCYWVMV